MKNTPPALNTRTPYSPDLTPSDCFLFPSLTLKVKDCRIDTIINIHSTVTAMLYNTYIAEDEFLGVPKIYVNSLLSYLIRRELC
jgi:hypothetical protein